MSNDRRTKADKHAAAAAAVVQPKAPRKELGPYLVPLHLNGAEVKAMEPSVADIAAVRYSHWVSMLHRSNGRGFRLDRGTGSKRRNPHNVRRNGAPIASDLAMVMNGHKLMARHGNHVPGSAFQ